MDKSTDTLYEKSFAREEESPNVVHLTHLTTPDSIYHLPIGFASFASKPQMSKWYLWVMWPVTVWSVIMTCIHGRAFIVERNAFGKLKLQSWAIPRYTIQVSTVNKFEYERLKGNTEFGDNLVLSRSYAEKIWLVGDGLSEEEQLKASKGTLIKKVRNECLYHHTPAMVAPSSFENLNSCEVSISLLILHHPLVS
ncbi:hypothetical protein Vadar_008905 [Vaccinium darrowii]|uniref:Uncharacterized protein n=1 Tax=Vaccinium darrowii TaxID=229202 RepID=A0ACB7WYY8_9ERIC|nr:hypothetical protein Vadar_008905 [Vaccinium darrowii]